VLCTKNVASVIFWFAILLIGSAYPIGSRIIKPKITLDQVILFRPFGDPDYLPQVSALARLELGEASVKEMAGRGVRSFPFASVLLHATLVRLLGDVGFVVADLLAYVLYAWMLSTFLRCAGITRPVAEVITLLVVSGAFTLILASATSRVGLIPVLFWEPRFPRPLITELIVVAFLVLAIRLFNNQTTRSRLRAWVLMGVLGACLIQSDIYQAANMILVATLLVFYLVIRDWKIALRGAVFAGCVAAVMCMPFLYQRLHESPDVLRRWGVFYSHHRLILLGGRRLFALAFLTLIVEAVLCWRHRGAARADAKGAALVTGAAVVVSLASGPLSLLVLGRGLQAYHYTDRAMTAIGYALLLCAGWVIQDTLRRPYRVLGRHKGLAFRIERLAFASAVVVALAAGAGSAYKGIRDECPTAPSMLWRYARGWAWPEPAGVNPRYQSSFAELRAELVRPEHQAARVLGTFDIQLASWWEYRNKYLYLPDVFNTTVSDREIEARVYLFLRRMGATPEDFDRLLDNWYFLARVVSSVKHQANAVYTPWPIQDYSPDAQRRIASTPIMESFHLELPLSERRRLLESYAHFEALAQPWCQLDVIVLTKGQLRRFLHPEGANLRLAWANDAFEVWVPGNRAVSSSSSLQRWPTAAGPEARPVARPNWRREAAATVKVRLIG
jgi:hypothetical protein